MQYTHMNRLYFSPNGTTKTVLDAVTAPWEGACRDCDMLTAPLRTDLHIPSGETLTVALPVYAGRIPPLCRDMLAHLSGDGAPAVAVVVYGNREYDDALLELVDLLEGSGFHVIGAGAFIAQHSIFPHVAAGRPDEQDHRAMAAFAQRCADILAGFCPENAGKIVVKGNPDYRQPGSVPHKPSGNRSCTRCGACVRLCPTRSIPTDDPRKTNAQTCISCGACIHACPVQARAFRGAAYRAAAAAFYKKNAAYKKPEVFYVQPS